MLKVLAGRGLSDALVVVVRWFGGTKLGKGGLARAYGATVRDAVEAARLVERFPTVLLAIAVPYERLGAVKRLLRPPEVELEDGLYQDTVSLKLRVAKSAQSEVEEALADLGIVARRC
jgi:putative IMPACT (imprinted ancient) family translation regulator